jgi:two-component system response regulator NreC
MRLLLDRQPGFVVVAEASDGRETLDLVADHQPDVVVMDIAMPNMNGIEATRRIVEKHPGTGVVILSMHHDESYVIRSLKAGARAYLLKDAMKAELIDAIHAVAEGKSFFSPKISRILQEDYVQALGRKGADDSYELLTDREREILQLVAEGKTNKEIANTLNLSLYTVDTHRTHILQKLNLHSVPEVILYAVRKGIIS